VEHIPENPLTIHLTGSSNHDTRELFRNHSGSLLPLVRLLVTLSPMQAAHNSLLQYLWLKLSFITENVDSMHSFGIRETWRTHRSATNPPRTEKTSACLWRPCTWPAKYQLWRPKQATNRGKAQDDVQKTKPVRVAVIQEQIVQGRGPQEPERLPIQQIQHEKAIVA